MKFRPTVHFFFWFIYLAFETTMEFAWVSVSYVDKPILYRLSLALQAEIALLLVKIPYIYGLLFLTKTASSGISSRFKQIGFFLVGSVLTLVIYRGIVGGILIPYLYHESVEWASIFQFSRMISSILDLLTLAGIAVGLFQYQLRIEEQHHQKQLEADKAIAELRFLRAQIHPHFLFNTLNNMYGLARKKSEKTAESILRLSGLLRFMLYETGKSTIPISDEIKMLDDYIELERLRYGTRLTFTFRQQIDDLTEPISPLILLPLVENAFKHGAGESTADPFITIELTLQNGLLQFMVFNSKETVEKSSPAGKIGLSNLRRQLAILYPDHDLSISETQDLFTAQLTIQLKNYAGTLVSNH